MYRGSDKRVKEAPVNFRPCEPLSASFSSMSQRPILFQGYYLRLLLSFNWDAHSPFCKTREISNTATFFMF